MSRSPTLAEVVRGTVTSYLEGVHTAIPGKVVRYDKTKQQADVQPLVQVAYFDEEGDRVVENLPVIPNCPVQFSGGGGVAVTHPVAVGDEGMVFFSEACLDTWLSSGSTDPVDPTHDRRNHLADGVFVPGVYPFSRPRAAHPDDAVGIGVPGGAYQGVALGDTLKTFLDSLKSALDSHTHVAPGGGGVTSGPTPTSPSVPTVSSTALKVTP